MEILTPQPEAQPIVPSTQIPQDMLDAGLSLKNIEFLDYLGMKDEMFNSSVMEKINFLAEHHQDLASLKDMDMRLGIGAGMSKIDKLYSYVKLDIQSRQLQKEQELISNQMRKYE